MSYKNPVVSPLTEPQEQLLGQLGSLKNILTLPTRKRLNIPADKQISTFDYLLRLTEYAIGRAFMDILLKKFLDEIFSPSSYKLEKAILRGIAKTLDKQNKHISSNPDESNLNWLNTNALEPFHTVMQVVKALIVKQIIAMIFGPKEKMNHNTSSLAPVNTFPLPNNNDIINDVVSSSAMFSLSNAESNEYGDIEYNQVKLREQLEKGEVQFTISCQDVKIKLPENFDQEINNIVNSAILSIQGTTAGGGTGVLINPAIAFDYIGNHVKNETQRINTQENANAIKKSFLQILVEKVLNVIVIALAPYLADLLNQINTENPSLNLALIGLITQPFELQNLSSSDPAEFDNRKIFMETVVNTLYAILLATILKALIPEIKKIIKNALAKRAAIRAQSKFKRLSISMKNKLGKAGEKLAKAEQSAAALIELEPILKFLDT